MKSQRRWNNARALSVPASRNPRFAGEYNLLWISDSIYNMDDLPNDIALAYGADQLVTNYRATYGSCPIGTGLLEVADTTYAYTNGAWTACTRGLPYSHFRAMVFEFARNDGGYIVSGIESKTSFRQAYDKLVSQGLKFFPKVVSGVCVPKANATPDAWDLANDEYYTLNIGAEVDTVVAKYNTRHVDVYNKFLNLVTAGTYTVAQIMRDSYHPQYVLGSSIISGWILTALADNTAAVQATPEITGNVVNYLFGEPATGSWAFMSTTNTVGPNEGPVPRIANLPDQGLNIASSGKRLVFPSTAAKQVWVHWYRQIGGGSFRIYIDRGTANEVSLLCNTNHIYDKYPLCNLVSGSLGSGLHTIELETTNASPVCILGITAVGA